MHSSANVVLRTLDEFLLINKQELLNEESRLLLEELFHSTVRLVHENKKCEASREVFLRVVESEVKFAIVPERIDPEQIDDESEVYSSYITNTEYILQHIIELHKLISKEEIDVIATQLRPVFVLDLILFASHNKLRPWNNYRIQNLTQELMDVILTICNSPSTDHLLLGSNNCLFDKGLVKPYLSFLLLHLKSDTWKKNPSMKFVFEWCLYNIQYPHLGDFLSEVIPPTLLFVDDFGLENKILGVSCLHHIIQNVNPTELRCYGRAEVIYDALYHLLYTQEPALIPILYPCLLDILHVVDIDSSKEVSDGNKFTRHDKVFNHILTNMELEQKIVLRTAYIVHLQPFILKMGIVVVKRMKRVLRVIFQYIEVHNEPEVRKNALTALKCLLIETWPRIPAYMELIFKNILKFTYDVQTDNAQASESVTSELLNLAIDCLLLLHKIAKSDFENLYKPLQTSDILPVKRVINQLTNVINITKTDEIFSQKS